MEAPQQKTNVDEQEPTRTALESRAGQNTRRATGPRTAAGKRRSRYNATKSGIFAKGFLLDHESHAEFDLLVRGLREDLRPHGPAETALVENLAVILWRKRRLFQSERAQTQEAVGFTTFDSISAQALEVWDRSREGESSGGMLRHDSNPYVIREAVYMLTLFRANFEKYGFQEGKDPWLLRKIYGLDRDGAAPLGLFCIFQNYSKLATGALEGIQTVQSVDQLKKGMLEIFDKEIDRLRFLEALRLAADEQRGDYQTTAALILRQGDMNRNVRYEAHLSREFDRILNQIERLQRIRLGQPTPPTIRLEI